MMSITLKFLADDIGLHGLNGSAYAPIVDEQNRVLAHVMLRSFNGEELPYQEIGSVIAAAPDLLEACKALMHFEIAHVGPGAYEAREKAKAAISRAQPKP